MAAHEKANELTKALSDLSRSPISADRLKRLEKLLIELFERIDRLEAQVVALSRRDCKSP